MNILFLGDIVGDSGCNSVKKNLPKIIKDKSIDFVVVNGENAATEGVGLGLFEEFADYILGTEFRIGAVFMLLVFILVYRRFKLSKKREYLK